MDMFLRSRCLGSECLKTPLLDFCVIVCSRAVLHELDFREIVAKIVKPAPGICKVARLARAALERLVLPVTLQPVVVVKLHQGAPLAVNAPEVLALPLVHRAVLVALMDVDVLPLLPTAASVDHAAALGSRGNPPLVLGGRAVLCHDHSPPIIASLGALGRRDRLEDLSGIFEAPLVPLLLVLRAILLVLPGSLLRSRNAQAALAAPLLAVTTFFSCTRSRRGCQRIGADPLLSVFPRERWSRARPWME